MKHTVNLLLGAGAGSGLPEVITEYVRAELPPDATLAVQEADTISSLRRAGSQDHDLAVLVLNNILNDETPGPPVNVALALDVVRELSDRGLPVIVLWGFDGGLDVSAMAKAAGARFYSPLPPRASAFQAAVRECLSA